MSYFHPLITASYWFSSIGSPFAGWAAVAVGAVIALIFAEGLVFKYLAARARRNPPLHRVLSRWGRAALTVSIVGAVLYFFTYEQIVFVSARFWWILLAAGAIWWKTAIVIDIRTRYRAEKKALAERQAKEKYLP